MPSLCSCQLACSSGNVLSSHKAAGKLNISCRYFIWNQVFLFSRVSFLSSACILGNGINIFSALHKPCYFHILFPSSRSSACVYRFHKLKELLTFLVALYGGYKLGPSCQPACASLLALPLTMWPVANYLCRDSIFSIIKMGEIIISTSSKCCREEQVRECTRSP